MSLPLREALIARLRARFGEGACRVGPPDGPVAVFPAWHPAVGDAVVQDDGDELTLYIGDITHRHFSHEDDRLGPAERADRIAEELTQYLDRLFSDQIEFFGDGRAGGARVRSPKPRGFVSRLLFGHRTYVWSGPLEDR